jgi:Undecaprenyl-phosphate glucose phosphotransferase
MNAFVLLKNLRASLLRTPDGGEAARSGLPHLALAESYAPQRPQRAQSAVVLRGVARLIEFLLVVGVGAVAHERQLASPFSPEDLFVLFGSALLAQAVFQALGLNTIHALLMPFANGLRIIGAWSFVFLSALAAAYFLKLDPVFSKTWLQDWCTAGGIALVIERILLSLVVRRITTSGALQRNTAIVGGGPAGDQVLRELAAQRNTDVRICGVFDDRDESRSGDVVAGFPRLGGLDDLLEYARRRRIDLIIFTLPITAEKRLADILRKLRVLPVDIRLAARNGRLPLHPRTYSWIGSVPLLDLADKPIVDWDALAKAALDRVLGALLLVGLSPLMLLIAMAVRLDSNGPALFRQKRYGFNNEEIEIYKFRTLRADACDEKASTLVTRNDTRVTRVGRFLRRTSLDELPQLIDVAIGGSLSLVGPRPHAPGAKAARRPYDHVVDEYFARHRVRPGITGWAQVNGWRGETDTEEKIQKRVEFDLFYIEHWSLLFDIYIILRTPIAVLKGLNAY